MEILLQLHAHGAIRFDFDFSKEKEQGTDLFDHFSIQCLDRLKHTMNAPCICSRRGWLLCLCCWVVAATSTCPLGSVTIGGVKLGVPSTPLDWCLGYNTTVRPNTDFTMVGVTITPQGDDFLVEHGRGLWKYLDIRTDIAENTTGTIFENLFGMTYSEYSAIPAVSSNPVKGWENQPIVYLTPKDLAKVWILTTDGAEGVSADLPSAQGGYASAAGTIAVAGQESGGQNPGAFTYQLNSGGRPQFNSPITALDPVFAVNPANDDGSNGGFWQISNFVTTPSVLPCFENAGWQGTTVDDAKKAILYNPFFQAKITMFWATKKIDNVVCTTGDNTPCTPNQSACTGLDWIQDKPDCLAGALCKGDGIWNAPLVDSMFNILTGADQTAQRCNGMPTSLLSQFGTYLAAVDLIQAGYVPTAPSSWSTDTNFNVACQSMPRFVETTCNCGDPCPPLGYPTHCSTLPYWAKPTSNGNTCGGQNCLDYQTSVTGFPIPTVPSGIVSVSATILAPAERRLLGGGGSSSESLSRWTMQEEHKRRLPTLVFDNFVYNSGLCTDPSDATLNTTADFPIAWTKAPLADQIKAFIAQQASLNNVTICSLTVLSVRYVSRNICQSLVKMEKALALSLCKKDRVCRKAAQTNNRLNMYGCKTAHKFCRATLKEQRKNSLLACKQSSPFNVQCRKNATGTFRQLSKTC